MSPEFQMLLTIVVVGACLFCVSYLLFIPKKILNGSVPVQTLGALGACVLLTVGILAQSWPFLIIGVSGVAANITRIMGILRRR